MLSNPVGGWAWDLGAHSTSIESMSHAGFEPSKSLRSSAGQPRGKITKPMHCVPIGCVLNSWSSTPLMSKVYMLSMVPVIGLALAGFKGREICIK